MKETLISIVLTILFLIGIVALSYALWIAFIPMQIGEKVVERKVLMNSPQYIISQKTALVGLYKGYTEADSDARRTAIKGQMCQIITNIPASEVPSFIKGEIVCN